MLSRTKVRTSPARSIFTPGLVGSGMLTNFSNDTSPYTRNAVLSTKRSHIKKCQADPAERKLNSVRYSLSTYLGAFPKWLESDRDKQPRGGDAPNPASAEPQSS